ncbi:MAG: hypothetical protein ACFFDT_11480, partial [Candidatus Hodarchaeota archaeon]
QRFMIQKLIKSKKQVTVIIIPRGFGKSAIIGFLLVLWLAIFKKAQYIMLISKTLPHAVKLLSDIKNACQTTLFTKIFGDLIGVKWSDRLAHLYSESWGINCYIEPKGIGSQIRGSRIAENRIQFAIVDDPEDDEETESSEAISKKERWFNKVLLPALQEQDVEGREGKVWWLGTLLARDCVVGRVIDKEKYDNVEVVNIPAIVNSNRLARILKIPKGKSIWEDMFSTKRLDEIRKSLIKRGFASVWWSEYMGDPRSVDELVFQDENNMYFEPEDVKDKEIPLYLLIDSAYQEKKTSSRSSLVLGGFDSERNLYIFRCIEGFFSPQRLFNWVLQLLKYANDIGRSVKCIGIESISYKILKLAIKEKVWKAGYTLYFKQLEPKNRHKKDRIRGLIPYHEEKKLYMRRDQTEAIGQMHRFPQEKGSIDSLDIMAYLLDIAKNPNAKPEKEREILPENSAKRAFIERMEAEKKKKLPYQRLRTGSYHAARVNAFRGKSVGI